MKEATCKKCSLTKPVSDFYKQQYSRISGLGECADCTKARVKANRLVNVEYYRAFDRSRGNRQPPDYFQSYRGNNKAKYAAHTMLNNAVRDGRIDKLKVCEDCGLDGKIHGHHDDYSKPLEVRWLCAACHRQWHIENGEAKNGRAA